MLDEIVGAARQLSVMATTPSPSWTAIYSSRRRSRGSLELGIVHRSATFEKEVMTLRTQVTMDMPPGSETSLVKPYGDISVALQVLLPGGLLRTWHLRVEADPQVHRIELFNVAIRPDARVPVIHHGVMHVELEAGEATVVRVDTVGDPEADLLPRAATA
ncbi:MAG: hypothetical protein M3P18_00440 [Actinomycetota bacterium]|nr:hypothetical protein [Actinomycetota bacterium]